MENPSQESTAFKAPLENKYMLHRRFDRLGRLVGDANMEKLFRARVSIIGIGGVGSWAAESLARSGVGHLQLVDFDEICVTNANRQLHTLQGLVGQKKAQVMSERLRKVNPQADVQDVVQFYSEETSEEIFKFKPDFILDCIDNLTAKSHLISRARELGIRLVTATGAGARLDPARVKMADLSESHTDPMAAQLRKILRTKYAFPREGSFDIPCVFSDEIPMEPMDLKYDCGQGFKCVCPQGQNNLHSCEHRNVIYGNASFVTGSFGFHMASWVVRQVIGASP